MTDRCYRYRIQAFTNCAPMKRWLFAIGLLLPSAAPAQTLLYTDWTVVPGRVFYQGSASEQTLMQAAAGRIYSVKAGPDGGLVIVDANTRDVLTWAGGAPQVLYHHTTYVRDTAFDAQGRLYFSEATGAGGNGFIYRLDDSGPVLFYTVNLVSVGGFWAGHFAFAPDGTLYLSTGNRIPSSIYHVTLGGPVVFFSDPSGSIAGLDFDAAGNLYYADWFSHIYQVNPAAVRTVALTVPGRRMADVDVVTSSIAIGPEAGRVNSVALHPTSANIHYAATSSGGVFRTANGGTRWWLRSHGLANRSVDGILVHPATPATVFAVTPSGVFRSTDEGANWTQQLAVAMPLPPPAAWPDALRERQKNPIRFESSSGAIYAAPFCAGLYRSPDGVAWTQIYPPPMAAALESCVTSIDVSSAGGGTVYITTPLGIRQRVGGGAWTNIGAEISGTDPIALRVAPSAPDRLYVVTSDVDGWPPNTNVWVRPTAAAAFSPTTMAPPWPNWFYAFSLAVHPTNEQRLFFGSNALYSTMNASTWTHVICSDSTICGADYRGLAFNASGSALFAAHDQGIFRLDLATSMFHKLDAGLVNTQFYDADVGPDSAVYGGTQDTGGFRRAGTGDWTGIATSGSGDVLDLLAHPTNPLRVFIRTNSESVMRSDNAGSTIAQEPFVPSGGFWNHQLAYDAATTTMFAGTQSFGVYKSTDDGVSYAPANTGITNRAIRCIALQPGSNTVAYAGTMSNGLFKTTNGGTWSPLATFPETNALVIAVNPAATRVFAGTRSGIYVSPDGGSAWSPANAGLPPLRVVSELVIDPVCPCLMYAGLGFYDGAALYGGGVWQSSDGGANWTALTSGDDAALSVTSIRIDPADRTRLHIATFGSGVRTLFRSTAVPGGCSC
jgi:photosystem II stability/assembly factor-like uncharacterized protein